MRTAAQQPEPNTSGDPATMQTGLSSTFHCSNPSKPQTRPGVHHRPTREREAALNGGAQTEALWAHAGQSISLGGQVAHACGVTCRRLAKTCQASTDLAGGSVCRCIHVCRPACPSARYCASLPGHPSALCDTAAARRGHATCSFSRRVEGKRQQGNKEVQKSVEKAVRDAQVLPHNHQPARGV